MKRFAMNHDRLRQGTAAFSNRFFLTMGLILANAAGAAGTELGIQETQFTLNGTPTFLLGISYYGALGASEEFIRRDLDDAQRYGFNWIRVWAIWDFFGHDVSAVDDEGHPREPFLAKLKWLVAECDRRGVVVDVTLTRGDGKTGTGRLKTFDTHRRAVETLVVALQPHRNWYLDLANERNVRDARFVSFEELKHLRETVKRLDPQRLVTASDGEISRDDLRAYLRTAEVDFVCPHRPRHAQSPAQTEAKSQACLAWMKDIGRVVPVHYQEPFRRGYGKWEPPAEAFLTDLSQARAGGAAGWCFHNGDQKSQPDGKPRRSFDLREQRLFEQLDDEERKVLARLPLLAPLTVQREEGLVSLFNGQDLTDWKASENPESFVVRDGMIVAHGRPRSHLYYVGPVSSADFKNFEFKADVKTEPDSNGGIYFHTRYVDNNWPQAGCEVQVNNAQKEKRKTGSLYAIQDVADSPVKDGEWFNLHIIVRDKEVVVRVNGKTVVDWTQPADFQSPKNPTWSDRRLSSGTFALQAHDAKSVVYYKNIRVKPLDGPADRPNKRTAIDPTRQTGEITTGLLSHWTKLAVSAGTAREGQTVFPDKEWQEATPESQGVALPRLKAAVTYMDENFGPDGARELVIVRNGYLIWRGPDCDAYHEIYSATKVFTTTVLGLLVADGKCTLDTRAAEHLPDLDDLHPAYAKIRLRHLASMTGGYRGKVADVAQKEQPWGDPTIYVTTPATPEFEPAGSQVAYNDHDVHLLGRILATRVAREPLKDIFQRRIAEPIGMSRWDWGVSGTVDRITHYNAAGTPARQGNGGIQTTARELARLGLLYLNRGYWNGRQLLPASFVDQAGAVQVPATMPGRSRSFLSGAYGFYWWTNGEMATGKRRLPSAPSQTYFAHGHNCNFCYVIPEWNMVVVRLGRERIREGVTALADLDQLWDAFRAKLAGGGRQPIWLVARRVKTGDCQRVEIQNLDTVGGGVGYIRSPAVRRNQDANRRRLGAGANALEELARFCVEDPHGIAPGARHERSLSIGRQFDANGKPRALQRRSHSIRSHVDNGEAVSLAIAGPDLSSIGRNVDAFAAHICGDLGQDLAAGQVNRSNASRADVGRVKPLAVGR
ncbi:MAG: DUF1080 domain-containing protein [Planctomycetes bacterium]|nr:DUF1080 domain-containing protein [Planctomycetota bacterium]